ncbi:MAG: hypothetical protein HYX92_15620 [Chloroflexi bacterium]|nr:hypothetical protein [Chloroflexota bacterium]
MELEKRGIPTAGIVSSAFVPVWEARHRAMGLDVLPRVVVQPTLTEIPSERVREEVLKHAEELVEALTVQPILTAKPTAVLDESIIFEGRDFFDAERNLNRGFLDRGWGDGFPIVPPRREAVAEMLGGTSRGRDEVVIVMEPGRGVGTVEKIAINCVMAGCQPEHLPVVIAAVEAMSEPDFCLTTVAQSTGPQTPLLVVNGPIRKELGINSGCCALGPGAPSWVNTVIGRAIRLVMMNIGHTYPGLTDMDTIGSPNKYSMCMGENEEANPWEPLHVERGFDRDTSTVTVFPCGSFIDVPDVVSVTPEDVLTTFAHTANAPLTPSWSWLVQEPMRANRQPTLVLCPEHAKIIAAGGWTKNDIRRFMFHNSRLPMGALKKSTRPGSVAPGCKWIFEGPEETMVPVVGAPKDYTIVVVGADSGKSGYSWNWGAPVTKAIRR